MGEKGILGVCSEGEECRENGSVPEVDSHLCWHLYLRGALQPDYLYWYYDNTILSTSSWHAPREIIVTDTKSLGTRSRNRINKK